MSGKKFDIKKLVQLRNKQTDVISEDGWDSMDFPIDWEEFNKLFSSKRHVIVEYPNCNDYGTLLMVGFYSALKIANENVSIGMCNYGQRTGLPYFPQFYKTISNKPVEDKLLFHYDVVPKREKLKLHDEWILNADGNPSALFKNDATSILEEIKATDGFKTYDEEMADSKVVVGWEGMKQRRKKKVVVTWDTRDKKTIKWVMERYPDQFLFIPYTKEKRMVDEWFRNNETMVDPGFDMKLMDPSIDVRKALLYAATNHLHDFRRFARVLPEVVNGHLGKNELKCLL